IDLDIKMRQAMGLNRSTIKYLKTALADLEVERKTLDTTMVVIRSLLTMESRVDRQRPNGATAALLENTNRHLRRRRAAVQLGKRVFETMDSSKSLKAREVVSKLKDAGIKVAGRTSLPDRVQRELRRLRDKGIIERTSDGYYRLLASVRSV